MKLKQLGFNWGCRKMYGEVSGHNGLHDEDNYNQSNEKNQYSAPETVVALKWLREEKNLHIIVGGGWNSYNPFWTFAIGHIKESSVIGIPEDGRLQFKSFEEAESAGLDLMLDYLIKNKK
jgi:hypothetical protein